MARPTLPALLAAAAAALALLPAGALAADAKAPVTETATSGTVSATFTSQDAGDGQFKGLNIAITRGGAPAYSGMPKVKGCEQPYCAPDTVDGDARQALSVVDANGDGEPDVIVNVYSGGAHCCEIALVLMWNGTTYKPFTHNFADPGYRFVAAAGDTPAQFVTADARFGYEYTDYADSAMPLQILQLGDDGTFADQTFSHVAEIRADAARWKKAYTKVRRGRSSLGVLAAYIADEHLLGRQRAADAFLQHELRAGRLRTVKPWPGGKAYIKLLKKDLRSWGYSGSRTGATL
ncbi:hypothetical protein [Conexibacter woesei]|uniref:hypothetical protein n=1 Tax=Conexibacter woesei TaxID=191495 RepID=UPI000421BA5C|nr:hypothetical protein [Conexibacter woesei]